jgi:hypothetical protein
VNNQTGFVFLWWNFPQLQRKKEKKEERGKRREEGSEFASIDDGPFHKHKERRRRRLTSLSPIP